MAANPLRQLPAVTAVLETPSVAALEMAHGRDALVAAVRAELDALRERLRAGAALDGEIAPEAVAARVAARVEACVRPEAAARHQRHRHRPAHQPRPLAARRGGRRAAATTRPAATSTSNSTSPPASGRRRQDAVRGGICRLTGAESATAVNNCAAATVIVLRGPRRRQGGDRLARPAHRDRRQLPHPGDHGRQRRDRSARSARRTSPALADYEQAIGPNTAAAHAGPHEQLPHPRVHEVGRACRNWSRSGSKHNLPVIDDVGSGQAWSTSRRFGLPGEPVVSGEHRGRGGPGAVQRRQAARRPAGGDHRRARRS